jgi:hypothetical protein
MHPPEGILLDRLGYLKVITLKNGTGCEVGCSLQSDVTESFIHESTPLR